MKKELRGYVPLICFLFLLGSAALGHAAAPHDDIPQPPEPPKACHSGYCVSLEVVSKPKDLEHGLMDRPSMDMDKGMLFVFQKDDKYPFWMKNMHFSLDIVWINRDKEIVYVAGDIPACTKDPCPVYTPDEPARYVLEVHAGYADIHGWNPGDKVELNDIQEK
jgi:uncharacterized membrane protein (UPF0127 family)